MGLTYFGDKRWYDITREERYFCAVFYNCFVSESENAVNWINDKCELGLDTSIIYQEWEVGFEVALYRDYLHDRGVSFADKKGRFRKRTFDLCFFSEKLIIIVEAKSYSGLSIKQCDDFAQDKKDVEEMILKNSRPKVDIKLILLKSSHYKPHKDTLQVFDGKPLNWSDVHEKYKISIFKRADEIYPHNSTKCTVCNNIKGA